MGEIGSMSSSRVRLNVGGKIFETSVDLLCEKSEYFRALLKGGFKEAISSGEEVREIFIDRDSAPFKHIMRLIRDPSYIIPEEYAEELQYYMIEVPTKIVTTIKRVYSMPDRYALTQHMASRWTSIIPFVDHCFKLNIWSNEHIHSIKLCFPIIEKTKEIPTLEILRRSYRNVGGSPDTIIIDRSMLQHANALYVNKRLTKFRRDLEETSSLRILEIPLIILNPLSIAQFTFDIEIRIPHDVYSTIYSGPVLFVETERISTNEITREPLLPVSYVVTYTLDPHHTAFYTDIAHAGILGELWITPPIGRHIDRITIGERGTICFAIPGYLIQEQMIDRNINMDSGIYCWSFGEEGWQLNPHKLNIFFLPLSANNEERQSQDLQLTYMYLRKGGDERW